MSLVSSVVHEIVAEVSVILDDAMVEIIGGVVSRSAVVNVLSAELATFPAASVELTL